MRNYNKLAKDIIYHVGGETNILGVSHCISRLRFQLKEESLAHDDILKNMEGVVTIMHSAGQYQVVIGNHVGKVYEEVCKEANIKTSDSAQEHEGSNGIMSYLITLISGCIQPFLGVLCAAGMIKGLNALLIFAKLYSNTSGTYLLLNTIGDSLFHFMPVLVGYTCAKKCHMNTFTGMIIGAAFCYPDIQKSALELQAPIMQIFQGTFFESSVYTTVLGIPLLANNYTSSIIPVIAIIVLASKLEKKLYRIIPEILQNFFVPFFVLLISLSIGFLLIGPIISLLCSIVVEILRILYGISPVACGVFVGFFWQCLVIFGLHWALLPIVMMNISAFGFDDTIWTGMFGPSFAQTAVVMAMYFKLKDKKTKELCIPAIISGMCGVTEPAIYGLTLPRKKTFIYSMIGGAVGGAVMGLFEAKAYTMGGLGIFGVANYINTTTGDPTGMFVSFGCIIVSMLVGFLLTFFFWKDDAITHMETAPIEKTCKRREETIQSPCTGILRPLSECKDAAFAQGELGQGVLILPEEGVIKAPFNGTVVALFPTNHAIGIVSDHGVQMLIHIGIDTVQLDGKYFTAMVKQGDCIAIGDELIRFDIEAIQKEGYCCDTPILITNTHDYKALDFLATPMIHTGDVLVTSIL